MLQTYKRLYAIDAFRAINMFFMIFVNDLSGVRNVPEWIDHVKGNTDGMHFADTIFPLFLFIAGLSIPLGIGRRINKGESFKAIAAYILLRSFALIVMGFFHVNMEEYSSAAFLPYAVWELLLTISFFLIWMDYPETLPKAKKYFFIGTGIVTLFVLSLLYEGGTPRTPEGFHPSWWGILGIIGWAYLLCSGIYLIAKGKFSILIIALIFFVLMNLGVHAKMIHFNIWVVNDGSSASLMMFGVVISLSYSKIIAGGSYKRLWPIFTAAGIALIALGFLVRPYTQGISKIHSTPSWVFLCTGIGILFFELIIWLVDVLGKKDWFSIIKPAGTSTLTCYLVPYLMVSLFSIVHFRYPHVFNYGTGGLIRCFAISFIVILITGFLEKRRLRLKI